MTPSQGPIVIITAAELAKLAPEVRAGLYDLTRVIVADDDRDIVNKLLQVREELGLVNPKDLS